jgi:uncharacterized cupredoxin-like copper-binding protein
VKTKTSHRWGAAGALAGLALAAAACWGGDDTKTVTAADYSFQNLPKSASTSTQFTLENSSTKELHEMVAIRIPDNEKRSAQQLMALPESEQDKVFGDPQPAFVLIAPPKGGQMIKAVGDGKITQKGRYVVICAIPTGADPQAYLAAAQNSQGPPDVPGGPPHFTQGMFGEITVK